MDMLEYYWKKATGALTADEEQMWRAQQAAAQPALRAEPAYVPPGVAPPQVQPGNALRARQDVMDDAMKELQRQSNPRLSGAPVTRTPEELQRMQEDELRRSSPRGGVRM